MHPLLGRRLLPLVAVVTTGLLVGSLAAPALADDTDPTPTATTTVDPGTTASGANDPNDAAQQALAQVQAIQSDTSDERAGEPATTSQPQDLTMARRDLRLRLGDLTGRQRAQAKAELDRPSANQWKIFGATGSKQVMVHWTAGDVSPTWVNTVGATVLHVLATYQRAGYRAPESDGTRGNPVDHPTGSYLDIYLSSQLGDGVYGYCDSDQMSFPQNGPFDTWAYCAFDNDFAEFPHRSPIQNLRVTAAHELFHATQFAYDFAEDRWFMEATATWAEDEVYTAINDNRQYLPQSPMRQPRQSLDQFVNSSFSLRQYGEWIFFRYLSERYPHQRGALPEIMLDLWKRVDSTRGLRHDDDSIRAVNRELASRHSDLRRFYARFADANRHPRTAYSEGRAYPTAPATKSFRFTKGSHATAQRTVKLPHLSSATMMVRPASTLRGWKLHLAVDLPNLSRGSAALVTTYDAKGRPTTRWVHISKRGNGSAVIKLTSAVRRVDLTLSNGGIHYDCWNAANRQVEYSCRGTSLDDHRAMRYRLWATR